MSDPQSQTIPPARSPKYATPNHCPTTNALSLPLCLNPVIHTIYPDTASYIAYLRCKYTRTYSAVPFSDGSCLCVLTPMPMFAVGCRYMCWCTHTLSSTPFDNLKRMIMIDSTGPRADAVQIRFGSLHNRASTHSLNVGLSMWVSAVSVLMSVLMSGSVPAGPSLLKTIHVCPHNTKIQVQATRLLLTIKSRQPRQPNNYE
jgi:hypothetical protein